MNHLEDDGATNQDEWKSDYDREGDKWNNWEQNYDNQSWNNNGEPNFNDQRSSTTETNTVGRIEIHNDNTENTSSTTAKYAIMGVLPDNGKEQSTNYLLVDSGAAVSVCPWSYKEELGHHFDYKRGTKLTAANGTTMHIYGNDGYTTNWRMTFVFGGLLRV